MSFLLTLYIDNETESQESNQLLKYFFFVFYYYQLVCSIIVSLDFSNSFLNSLSASICIHSKQVPYSSKSHFKSECILLQSYTIVSLHRYKASSFKAIYDVIPSLLQSQALSLSLSYLLDFSHASHFVLQLQSHLTVGPLHLLSPLLECLSFSLYIAECFLLQILAFHLFLKAFLYGNEASPTSSISVSLAFFHPQHVI